MAQAANSTEAVEKTVLNKTGYGVQIMATQGKRFSPGSRFFRNLTNVDEYQVGDTYKYVVGCEPSAKKAEEIKQEMIKLGFRNPFIVQIENGYYKSR